MYQLIFIFLKNYLQELNPFQLLKIIQDQKAAKEKLQLEGLIFIYFCFVFVFRIHKLNKLKYYFEKIQ